MADKYVYCYLFIEHLLSNDYLQRTILGNVRDSRKKEASSLKQLNSIKRKQTCTHIFSYSETHALWKYENEKDMPVKSSVRRGNRKVSNLHEKGFLKGILNYHESRNELLIQAMGSGKGQSENAFQRTEC